MVQKYLLSITNQNTYSPVGASNMEPIYLEHRNISKSLNKSGNIKKFEDTVP